MLFLPEDEDRQGEGGLRTQGYFKKSYENKPLINNIYLEYKLVLKLFRKINK